MQNNRNRIKTRFMSHSMRRKKIFTRRIDKRARLHYNSKSRGGAGIGRQARLRCVCFARTSSSLVHRTRKNSDLENQITVFSTKCSAVAEREAFCEREVHFVREASLWDDTAEHLTSHCGRAAILHCALAQLHLRRQAQTSLIQHLSDLFLLK